MTSIVPREKTEPVRVRFGPVTVAKTLREGGKLIQPSHEESIGTSVSKLWISEGHPANPKTGKRESGGPFYVTHFRTVIQPGHVSNVVGGNALDSEYSGPVVGSIVSTPTANEKFGTVPSKAKDLSSLDADGTTAISLVAPTNPTANLSTTLAETFREGVPTLPGIQSWKRKTEILRNAGSEYLNYQFGWAPLVSEVHETVKAARHHRDILQNYRHNEGKNVHRRFDFPSEHDSYEEEIPPLNPNIGPAGNSTYWQGPESQRVVRVSTTRKRWFEGCFTYGGLSKTDSFGRAIGFGSEADAVYGLNLNPEVLWELTPWSWAVDWFTNAGDLIKNVSSFALAGLVMRYGYMMEETIHTLDTVYSDGGFRVEKSPRTFSSSQQGACSSGQSIVTKFRAPANPFGFGVGWEGLSPTQLAITAAIGITRLL